MYTAVPTYLSPFPLNTRVSVANVGARLLGMPLKRQGRKVAFVLEAKLPNGKYRYKEVAVQMPRRATKTTSIWSVLIGRCKKYPGYRVVVTAQDGTRAGEKIREHMEILEQNGFESDGHGTLFWSNGKERIKFANGSMIWVVAPKPGAFRSAAADVILFDEAGELDPATSEALLAGALPLMDTRDNPQVIITGTPSKGRAGMLWHALENGRNGKPKSGIVDFSLRDDETFAVYDEDDPDAEPTLNEELIRRVHPGIGTLTNMDTMRERFEKMQLPQFEMEYGGRFPFDNASHAVDPIRWRSAGTEPGERPSRVGIAFDCAYDGSSASLAYAWRDENGVAFVEIVAHRGGTSWLPSPTHAALQKFRNVPIAYDQIGANLDPGTALSRMKPAPKIDKITLKDVMGATQRFVSNLNDGKLQHFNQSDLNEAIANATWRDIQNSGRVFGQKVRSGPAINPLVACALALWSYDRGRDRQPVTIAI